MISPELLQYVESALKSGSSEEDIRHALLGAGWRAEDIGAAFVTVRAAKDQGAQPLQQKPPQSAAQTPAERAMMSDEQSAMPKRSVLSEVAPRTQTPAQSPIQVVSQTKPEPQPKPTMSAEMAVMQMGRRSRRKFVSAIVAVVVVLLVSGGVLFAYTQHYWPFAAQAPQDVVINTPPPPPEAPDPLKVFGDAFASRDYKVTLSGKVSYVSQSTSSKTSLSAEFAPENFALYRNGVLAWLSEKKTGEVLMISSSTLYLVDNKAKTYSNIADPKVDPLLADMYRDIFKSASPIDGLLGIRQDENIHWTKGNENEWEAKITTRFFSVAPLDLSEPVWVKINLHTPDNLINTLSMKFAELEPWQDIVVTYEPVDNLDELVVLPKGYKETTLK